MKDVCFMHIQGSKLYGTIITGQVLWDVLMLPNGLKLFKHSPSLTFSCCSLKILNANCRTIAMLNRWPDASVHGLLCGLQHATSYGVQSVVT
jgi:hypothetical protein